ncbi:hypothetical protein Adt_34386 [Abeliophyllum distichum]|uniref:Senescence regulator n=1 Tax=Abeliophyllum distichum TaxID=126358 RepID=A0ABD1QZ08_9LAMI
MASRKSYRFLGAGEKIQPMAFNEQFEFDESQIWTTNEIINPSETKKLISNPLPLRKPSRKITSQVESKSMPVNVPDWSKILRGEYKTHCRNLEDDVEEDEDEDGNDRIPPHEYLARTRVASFSVHEGVGRTLKGRDLSQVRNAIWKQTGFED